MNLEEGLTNYKQAVWASKDARAAGEKCRDYYNHQQYTASEREKRDNAGKALVQINKMRPKINRLVGEVISQRTDPKAFPRTPDHEQAADAATDGLVYACDAANFDAKQIEEAEKLFIEGTFGMLVEVDPKNFDIKLTSVPWDRFFHDPHSLRKDFGDARYMGIVRWVDIPEAKREYPGKEDLFVYQNPVQIVDGDTFNDKPDRNLYWDYARKRVCIIQQFYQEKGQWYTCTFTQKGFLVEPKLVGYVDEYGETVNPMIMASAYVDRQGQRSGHAYTLLDLQDEINHQRNKAIDYLNHNQTWSRGEALTDKEVTAINIEKEDPTGHVQFPIHGEMGKDFGFFENKGVSNLHYNFYADAVAAIDDVGASDALQGKQSNSSGRAQLVASQNALKEVLIDYELFRQWRLRIYKAIWQRIRQFWKEEKWLRITDDESKLRYVGLNVPVTRLEVVLAERDGVSPLKIRDQYKRELQQAYQQDPRWKEPAGVANEVAAMEVDIVLDEVPDAINLQAEQFETLAKLAERYGPEKVPFEVILDLSAMRNKDKIKDMLKGDDSPEAQAMQQQAMQQQQEAADIAKAKEMSEIEKNQAQAGKYTADAKEKEMETFLKGINANDYLLNSGQLYQ